MKFDNGHKTGLMSFFRIHASTHPHTHTQTHTPTNAHSNNNSRYICGEQFSYILGTTGTFLVSILMLSEKLSALLVTA